MVKIIAKATKIQEKAKAMPNCKHNGEMVNAIKKWYRKGNLERANTIAKAAEKQQKLFKKQQMKSNKIDYVRLKIYRKNNFIL